MRHARNDVEIARLAHLAVVAAVLAGAAGCYEDPQYIYAPTNIEVGTGAEGDEGIATVTFDLPFDAEYLNSVDYAREREDFLTELNARLLAMEPPLPEVTADQLPLVRLDQVEISLEWTIKNLSDQDGQARIHVNGGNQYWYYVPANFIVEDDEEEAVPPPLTGDVPLDVAAGATRSGVFREDTLREAALDLELITRGGLNPFAAVLSVHEDIQSTAEVPFVQPDPENPVTPPPPLPIEAFGHFVRFDLTFEANRHMVLEFAVRVRERQRPGLLHDELADAPVEERYPFMPAEFVPALPAP